VISYELINNVKMAAFTKNQINIQASPFQHSTPSSWIPTKQTQLQFNLRQEQPQQCYVRKPQPIIIEKLMAHPQPKHIDQTGSCKYNQEKLLNNNPLQQQAETMLSSEKLAVAVQLAKMDIRKLKTMLSSNDQVHENEITQEKSKKTQIKTLKDDAKRTTALKEKRSTNVEEYKKPKRYSLYYPEAITNNNRLSGNKPNVNSRRTTATDNQPNVNLRRATTTDNRPNVYSRRTTTTGNDEVQYASKEEKELAMLQKDILNYSQTLNNIVDRLGNKPYNMNAKNEDGEFEEHKKKQTQAEEQKTRSSRMIYTLEHKINQLRDDQSKQPMKPSKKTAYAQSLASAHRAAVRTLQTFVSHAPLYYDTNGSLPSSYQQLAALVQRLIHLSKDLPSRYTNNNALETIQELIGSLNKATRSSTVPYKHNKINVKDKSSNKKAFLDERESWIQQKAADLNIKSFQREDATPERLSTLKHAMNALNDGKTKNTKMSTKQGNRMKSVILPPNLKKRSKPFIQRTKSNFAAPTVLSRIREKPTIEKQENKITPPVTPKKNRRTYQLVSPKKVRDEELIKEARERIVSPQPTSRHSVSPQPTSRYSPTRGVSPVSFRSSPPLYYNSPTSSPLAQSLNVNGFALMKKEVYRQNWLDRLKAKEFLQLEKLGKMNSREFRKIQKEFSATQSLVQHAENEIRERLKPLLDKAEQLGMEEAKRENDYKTSIQQRLAALTSKKALSEGDRLGEYILDDLIREAAADLQQIELEKEAESDAAYEFDRPTIESVAQHLQAFEKEEEDIRRHYQSVKYNLNGNNVDSMAYQIDEQPVRDMGICTKQGPVTMFTTLDENSRRKLPDIGNDDEKSCNQFDITMPKSMVDNVLLFKTRYENYIKNNKLKSSGFDPWILMEEICEEILTELCDDVSKDLSVLCDDFVEKIYEQEFIKHLN